MTTQWRVIIRLYSHLITMQIWTNWIVQLVFISSKSHRTNKLSNKTLRRGSKRQIKTSYRSSLSLPSCKPSISQKAKMPKMHASFRFNSLRELLLMETKTKEACIQISKTLAVWKLMANILSQRRTDTQPMAATTFLLWAEFAHPNKQQHPLMESEAAALTTVRWDFATTTSCR